MSQVDNVNNNNTDAQYAQYRAEKKTNLEKALPSGKCRRGMFVKGATAKKPPLIARPGAAGEALRDWCFGVKNFVTVQKAKESVSDIICPWTSYLGEVGIWENVLGKRFDSLHVFQAWYDPNDRTGSEIVKSSIFGRRYKGAYQQFPAKFCEIAAGRGAMPLITWEFRGLDFGGDRDLGKLPFQQLIDEIEAGKNVLALIEQGKAKPEDLNQYAFFKYILEWAGAAKAYGGPVIVRPFHEMTGNWYMSSIVANGGGLRTIGDGLMKRFPEYQGLLKDKNGNPKVDGDQNFIVAWCLMYDVFNKTVGASNVYFMFAPNWESRPDYDWNRMEAIYPGNEHTDIVGVSGHKRDSGVNAENMYEGPILGLQKMTNGEIPIALPEWSSGKFTSRPDFIKKMYELEMKYGVRLSVGFWVDKEDNWIPADTASIKEEQAAAANPYFSGVPVKGFDPDKAIAKNKYYLDQTYNEDLKKTEARVGYNESKTKVDTGEAYLDNSKISLQRIPKILRRDNALKLNFVKTVEDLLKNLDFFIVDENVKEEYAGIFIKNLAEIYVQKLMESESSVKESIKRLEDEYAVLENDVKDAVILLNQAQQPAQKGAVAEQAAKPRKFSMLRMLSRSSEPEKTQKKAVKLTLHDYLRYLVLPEIIKAAKGDDIGPFKGRILSKSDIKHKREEIIDRIASNTQKRIEGSKGKKDGEWSVIMNPTVSPAKKIAEGLVGELLTKMILDAIVMPENEYEYLEAINGLKDKFFGWIESGNNYFGVNYDLIAMRADRAKNRNGRLFRDPTVVGGYQLTVVSVDEATGKMIKTPYVSPTINICQEIDAKMKDPEYIKEIRLQGSLTVKLGGTVVMGGKNERAILGYRASAAAKIAEVMIDFYDSTNCTDINLLDKAREKIDDAERILKQKLALSYEAPVNRIWRDFKSMVAGQTEDFYLYVNIQMARAKLCLEYAKNPDCKEARSAKKEEALRIYKDLLRDGRLGEKRVDILEGIKNAYKDSEDPQLMTIAMSLIPELKVAQKKGIRKAGGLDEEVKDLQDALDIEYRK